jgi:GNAT superfamily N-acetyltransferase
MNIEFKPAPPHFAAEYIRLRGLTRENAVPEARLRELGITAESWASDIQSEKLQGIVARCQDKIIGYCFGNAHSGEVVVLAVLPAFESQGVGKRLLLLVVELLHAHGHTRLFLDCSSDPNVRSYGFYRHLGWRSAGTTDSVGNEVLEFVSQNATHPWCAGDV